MATTVKIRRSGTATATPSSLEHGELAINYADKTLYFKDSTDAIQSFVFQSYALATHAHAASDITSGTLDSARLPLATTGAAGAVIVGTGIGVSSGTVSVTYGTSSGTACEGNDARLSDARTPTSHTHGNITNDGKIGSTADQIVVTTTDGVLTAVNASTARTTLGVQPTASPAFTGSVGIGTSSPGALLEVNGGSGSATCIVKGESGQNAFLSVIGNGNAFLTTSLDIIQQSDNAATIIQRANSSLSLWTNNTTRLTISSTGTATFAGQIVGQAGMDVSGAATFANSGNVVPLTVTNAGTANSFVVNDASGDTTPFVITSSGNVGVGVLTPGVKLEVATASPSELGAVARFYHGPASDRSVEVGVYGTTPFRPYIQARASGSTANELHIQPDGSAAVMGAQLLVTAGSGSSGSYKPGVAISGDDDTGIHQVSGNANTLSLVTGGTERVRVDASGNLRIDTTGNAVVSDERLSVVGGAFGVKTSATTPAGIWNTNSSGTRQYVQFYVDTGTLTGQIDTNGTTTAYNTTSDYRLKTVTGKIADATQRLQSLLPCEYVWNSTGQNGEGFLAHELAQSVPHAVTGEKDAVNDDGSISPQQVDLAKVVPLLVAALQESNARIAALEERLNHA